MVEISQLTNPDRYCTGHIGDMPPELIAIYNNTLLPYDNIIGSIDSKGYSNNPSVVGFIGVADNLLSIYNEDKEFLQSRGITYEQISDKLQYMIEKYKQISRLIHKDEALKYEHDEKLKSLNLDLGIVTKCGFPYGNCDASKLKYVLKDVIFFEDNVSKYLILNSSSWGYQCCPFRSPKDLKRVFFGRPATGGGDDYWIYDISNCKSLSFNDLHIHMIREHGFFEGSVPYRLNPESVIDFFNLLPGINYKCKYRYVLRWKHEFVSGKHTRIPKSSDNVFEIRHIRDYNNFNPPSLDRFISYPEDVPAVAEILLFVKQQNEHDIIMLNIHDVPLHHKYSETMHEDGFKYVLKYHRDLDCI